MELYNEEGNKLRKKDLVPWYYDSKKKFVQVPSMTDEKEKIYDFLKFCVSISHPEVSTVEMDKIWLEAQDRQPGLLEALDQLRAEHEGNNDLWKAKSYSKAIKTIQSIKVPILSGAQAQKLPGIGKGIAGVIDEVLRHGRLKTQEERMENAIERQHVTEKFLEIWDVPTKTANEWYNLGNRSVADLVASAKSATLKMTERQKLGLKYHEDLSKEIPGNEVEDIVDTVGVAFEIKKVKGVEDTQVVGAYRRRLPTKEVEIAVKVDRKPTKGFVKSISAALSSGFVVDTPIIDAAKFSAVVRPKVSGVHRKLILRFVQNTEWGSALITLTGPESFIKILKEQAAVMGYGFGGKSGFVKLSEVDDNDVPVDAPDEKAVFDELGMKNIDPKDRM